MLIVQEYLSNFIYLRYRPTSRLIDDDIFHFLAFPSTKHQNFLTHCWIHHILDNTKRVKVANHRRPRPPTGAHTALAFKQK